MEKYLFTYDDCDQGDVMFWSYINVTLSRDIGPYNKGETFERATIDFNEGILELWHDEEVVYGCDLKLEVANV